MLLFFYRSPVTFLCSHLNDLTSNKSSDFSALDLRVDWTELY